MIISVNKLGLAAHIQKKIEEGEGSLFVDFKNKTFFFETDKTLHQWKIEYLSTCCFKHDSILCELRKYFYQKV